ncbi:MAG: TatD family hydrolase [Sphaerochaetaceae bacterium]|nr:TatD family hydrolase [Sphaerochaetaceae bacterium]
MLDIHRHLPLTGESPIPEDWIVWFATSSSQEWDDCQTTPATSARRIGYGILPVNIARLCPSTDGWDMLFERLSHKLSQECWAYVGEFGIDERYQDVISLSRQLDFARQLLRIAQAAHRPAVIHHVGSAGDLRKLLQGMEHSIPVIIHGFLGSIESARELASSGAVVSLAPSVWKRPTKLARRLGELDVPFLLETDFTGKEDRDYAGLMRDHHRRIAGLLGCEETLLEEKLHGFTKVLAHQPIAR